ncbi:MAG TPA: Gfo/Idh/MocA family oxidoreductase [Dehalococcoidia bacterium]|nr:Gfo/Idh/MocA family oxidoreductase [Dehalococcoidia bacterium]
MAGSAGKTLRVAVVGTGFGTAVQIPGFQRYPRTEVVAVASQSEAHARAAAARFGVPHVFTEFDALLELDGLDVVSIVTPPATHHAMTLAALRAGKHVLCEKPLALNQDEADEMLAEAQRTGLATMVDHEFRWLPARAYFGRLVREGWLGELRTVAITRFRGGSRFAHSAWGWQSDVAQGGGLLADSGSHLIDAIRDWFGEFAGVFGQLDTWITDRRAPAGSFRPVTSDDACAFLARMQSGALVTATLSNAAPFGEGVGVQAFGSGGALLLDADGSLRGARSAAAALRDLPIPEQFYRRDLVAEASDARLMPFVALVERFCGWALDGEPASPSFEDGVRNQRVLDAIVRSAKEGRWIAP